MKRPLYLWVDDIKATRHDLKAQGLDVDPAGIRTGRGARATILYPTTDSAAQEARIRINDPVYGADRAFVVLRPVNLTCLEALISAPPGPSSDRAWAGYAQALVFGAQMEKTNVSSR